MGVSSEVLVRSRFLQSADFHRWRSDCHQIVIKAAQNTQAELAKKIGTTQSVIARLEDAEYTAHSLSMLECIAAACGVNLKLHAEKKPHFDREVALV